MSTVLPRQWSITTLSAPDAALAVHRDGGTSARTGTV
jgi:hypothetical protein